MPQCISGGEILWLNEGLTAPGLKCEKVGPCFSGQRPAG